MTQDEPQEPIAKSRGVWEVLRVYPDFRRLYFARLISQFGDWFNLLAIFMLLGESNGDMQRAMPLAFVLVLKIFPNFLLGPIAGVLADRLDRRKIQIVCNILAAVVVLGFLPAGGAGVVLWIYILTLLQVSISAFYEPARQAILPNLVAKEDLLTANALYSVTWSAMFALGSMAGGLTLAFFGWEVAILIDAASYLVAALILLRIQYREKPIRHPREGKGGWKRLTGIEDMIEGLRYIRSEPPVFQVILAKFGWGSMGAITLFLTLFGQRDIYHIAGEGEDAVVLGTSYLWFCRAVGTGIGPLLARAFAGEDDHKLRLTISLGFFLALLLYVLLPFAPNAWIGGAMVLVAHIGGSAIWVICTVLLMKTVPDRFRGRTFAAELGLVMLASSMSNLVYAFLLDYTGLSLHQVLWIACAVCLIPALNWSLRARHITTQPQVF